jgi:hypothetical protein
MAFKGENCKISFNGVEGKKVLNPLILIRGKKMH